MSLNPPLSRFRYFTEREAFLQWVNGGGEAMAQRQHEIDAFPNMEIERFCYAHGGWSALSGEGVDPNDGGSWRERGACASCGAITRIRFAAEWISRAAMNAPKPTVYLTEQLTPLYKALRGRFPDFIGSEFVPSASERFVATQKLRWYTGNVEESVRHEDGTALTFANESIDVIGSFDVLEHIPNYLAALSEFHRVLRTGGQVLISVPFLPASASTLVRARIKSDGSIEHLETPEYHGNPTAASDGILCFYHFGWDLLDALRRCGFRSVALLEGWGMEAGLFGGQTGIVATK
jgi:SAM-dependent methyltransferase